MRLNERKYSEDEAGELLGGLSPRTLQGMRVRGTGPAFVKIGRLVRYPESCLAEYLAAQLRRSTSDEGGKAG